MCPCVRVCVRVCVRACLRGCVGVHGCVRVRVRVHVPVRVRVRVFALLGHSSFSNKTEQQKLGNVLCGACLAQES